MDLHTILPPPDMLCVILIVLAILEQIRSVHVQSSQYETTQALSGLTELWSFFVPLSKPVISMKQ